MEIASFNEFELFERLPYYLGVCISEAAIRGHYYIVFLDSYESMLARSVTTTPSTECDGWLRELFLSSAYIRIVIATRERLRWDFDDSEWNDYLDQHLLSNLSDEDSRWFLEQVPIHDETVVADIITHAKGVPLYLDMCVDLFEKYTNQGESFALDTKANGRGIINRYLRHFSDKFKYAIRVLAVPRAFNITFASILLEKQNLFFTEEELEELFSCSIILPIDEARSLWKTDESVRLHLHDQMPSAKLQKILCDILDCVRDNGTGKLPV